MLFLRGLIDLLYFGLVLSDTTILSKYRDTHFRRYQYRWGDDTFWYHDTRKYRGTEVILTT